MADSNITGQQQRDEHGLNIPIPDPSDKTITAVRDAIAQLSTLVDSKMGGIQAVIAEQFKSIDKRLADRDMASNLSSASAKENIAVALAAVVETGKSGNVRFDLLERRVAALELAITAATGKSTGQTALSTGAIQILGIITAAIGVAIAYYVATHK